MSALHHLLRRSTGALALGLAFAVLLGSLCPRGWFLCVHDEAVVLVSAHHANGQVSGAVKGADCREDGCTENDGCLDDDACVDHGCLEGAGCLDLALSLVLDDQTVALPAWGALPSGPVIASLPDLSAAALQENMPSRDLVGGPPPLPFVAHIRLLV